MKLYSRFLCNTREIYKHCFNKVNVANSHTSKWEWKVKKRWCNSGGKCKTHLHTFSLKQQHITWDDVNGKHIALQLYDTTRDSGVENKQTVFVAVLWHRVDEELLWPPCKNLFTTPKYSSTGPRVADHQQQQKNAEVLKKKKNKCQGWTEKNKGKGSLAEKNVKTEEK